MIRVLHVSTPAGWRGGEQQVFNLVVMQQQDKNVKPVVVCPSGSELEERLSHESVQVRSFHSKGIFKISLARFIAQCTSETSADIIHTHDSHAHTAAVISSALFGNKTPVIVHRRVDFPVSGNPFSKWKYNYPTVKKIISVSEKIRDITAPAIRDKNKLAVVYSGIDLNRYDNTDTLNVIRREFRIPEDVKIIGNLSALADHKDYPVFLETASILLKRNNRMRFVIAGEGPEEERIRKRIKELHLEKDVIMLGFRREIASVMQSLDVFLMTSKTEGLGTILIEAFAAGVPVVATSAGGIPELVKNGETGLLCQPGNAEELATAVEQMCSNNELRLKIQAAARNFAVKFSRAATEAATLSIYRSILNEP